MIEENLNQATTISESRIYEVRSSVPKAPSWEKMAWRIMDEAKAFYYARISTEKNGDAWATFSDTAHLA